MPAINNDEFWYDSKTLRKPIKPLEVSNCWKSYILQLNH